MATLEELAETIEAACGPLSPPLRAALLEVDRARFVRAVDRDLAYANLALPLDTPQSPAAPPVSEMQRTHGSWLAAAMRPEYAASGATISQPLMYLKAFDLLGLRAGERFLELGTGTGYGAALASRIVGPAGHVTSIDIDPTLVERARELNADLENLSLLCGDALSQAALVAQHDACWITFSVLELPPQLLAAVPEGGRLLAPIGPPPPVPQRYMLWRRQAGRLIEQDLEMSVFFIPSRAS